MKVRVFFVAGERPEDLAQKLRTFGWFETKRKEGIVTPATVLDRPVTETYLVVAPVDRGLLREKKFAHAPTAAGLLCTKLEVKPGTPIGWTDPFETATPEPDADRLVAYPEPLRR